MLGITVKDIDAHIQELLVLTDWLIDGYSGKLTCEEVVRAYKMATTGQLEIEQLFSLLVPKHIGTVLNAYLKYLSKQPELNRIFSQQLLLPDDEQSAEAIDTFMEECVSSAAEEVAAGKFYYDEGNGMYAWLVSKRRIVITSLEEVDKYRALAAEKISPPIGSEQSRHAPVAKPIGSLAKLVEQPLPQDYNSRLKACAMRLYLNDWLKDYHEKSKK
jgi:hypothetical protein